MPQVVSTCESSQFPACYATQFSLSSWEFFTTLDYEWRVIRGDLPHRWTIWVRIDRSFTLVHLPCCALGLICLVDLLRRACIRSRKLDSMPCQYGHCDPNRLSSEYRVQRLFLTSALTGNNIKHWILFTSVGTLSYAFSSPRRERLLPS
jgi:hypothetical protein